MVKMGKQLLKYALPVLLFMVLVVSGSLAHPLWGDEAETALFARNIIKYGIPKGWDGVNIMGIDDAIVLNKNLINHMSPWPQYYLTAASFVLFGESPFSARLPFIILAVLSLPLFYRVSLVITNNPKIALFSLWIASLSAQFILFSYQCRYYMISVFAGLLVCLSIFNLTKKSIWPKILFVVGNIVFFYAHSLSFIAFFIALLFSFTPYMFMKNFSMKEIKRFFKNVILLSLVVFLFCAPWYIIMNPTEGVASFNQALDPARFVSMFSSSLGYILVDFNYVAIFPLTFAIFLIYLIISNKTRQQSELLFLIMFVYFFLMILAGLNAINRSGFNLLMLRYTVAIFPFFFIISSYIIYFIWQKNRIIGILFFLFFIFTNIFSLQSPRSFFLEYIGEIMHPYQTPHKLVADYLNINAKKGDSAFVSLDYAHEPLIFYLRDKIRFVNRVSANNPRLFPYNYKILPKYIYSFKGLPDWIILYGKRAPDARPLPNHIDVAKHYKENTIPVICLDLSRPEISRRSFTEIKADKNDLVFIYKKIK
jgi:hypothetical protein